jgi:hypothetical protein
MKRRYSAAACWRALRRVHAAARSAPIHMGSWVVRDGSCVDGVEVVWTKLLPEPVDCTSDRGVAVFSCYSG